MNKPVIAAHEQATEPASIEIIESVDNTTGQRSHLALIPIGRIARQTIHLKSDEFTIAPQKEVEKLPR
jgi:hypothetical protein